MDKETLSNCGWIVICVLVLAVMLALATPFGNFISTAVKSTAQGLFDVNKNALNSTGLINVGDQSFDSKDLNTEKATFYYDNGEYLYIQIPVSGNMAGAPTIEEGRKFIKEYATILLRASFDDYLRDNGATENELWTELKLTDETFEPAVLGNGWQVIAKSTDKTSYGPILESINGIPITNMFDTFCNCTSLTTAPAIPNGVTNMSHTFYGCTSLTTAPAIPSGVTNMEDTFAYCKSLTTAPVIPNSVTNINYTFRDCKSLKTAPAIPSSVTNMTCTFSGCTSLATAPVIPNSVTDMSYTFDGCISLTTAPVIPSSVTDMTKTFLGCTSLTGTIEINANPTNYDECFFNTSKPIVLTGSSTMLNKLASTSRGNITVAQ